MENNGVARAFGEERNDVVFESDSSSSTDSDVRAHADSDSDGESARSEVTSEELDSFAGSRLVRVHEGGEQDQFVKIGFVNVMSGLGLQTGVETIYKNVYPDSTWQAKHRSFLEISRNMEKSGEGVGKVKFVWFGGPKDEISNIFRFGFASRGRGICLAPFHNPTASLRGCVADENGLYHMILCRALLGKSELIPPPTAEQRFPSSEEFHSAADNLASPRVYMVWSSFMNTHVMPQYVVSFRPPVKAKDVVALNPVRAADDGMIPFPKLVLELAPMLPASSVRMLQKFYGDYRGGKMTKQALTLKLRQLAGDDVLYRTIMSIKRRRNGGSEEAAPGVSNNAVRAQRKAGARSSANRVLKKLRGAGSP